MRVVLLIAGFVGLSLGGLWLLQGLGVLRIAPILCFADCAPVQGPSLQWAIAGFGLLAAGALAIFRALRRRA